jgi:hypothetical protein
LRAEAEVAKEYQIKAAFLYNFVKYVEWPARRFAAEDSPIVIGILGANPFGEVLAGIVKNRKVNGRSIEVKVVSTAADAATVHALFVGIHQDGRLAAMIGPLRDAAVLTVGESRAFIAAGGVIAFVFEGDKVRFEVNLPSAQESDLKISAQLLKLASAVYGKS